MGTARTLCRRRTSENSSAWLKSCSTSCSRMVLSSERPMPTTTFFWTASSVMQLGVGDCICPGARMRFWEILEAVLFVNRFLLLRGGAPLDELVVTCGEIYSDIVGGYTADGDETVERRRQTWERSAELSRSAGAWIHHALTFCQTRVIRFQGSPSARIGGTWSISDVFVSRLLVTLDLTDATLKYSSLDFSRCPALEELGMRCCSIHADMILSQSLRRLSITGCSFDGNTRCRISAPRFTSLRLVVDSGRAPILDEMPLLVTANVRFMDCDCYDICENNRYYGDCGDDENDSPREHILASKRLKAVKIKWYKQNKVVEKILRILTTYGVPTAQIQIEEVFNPPEGIIGTLQI
ncbi:hypothetical protein HU200_029329 [Digitaria exilis]|uniref:Uncharacterized protein n=1 Tax=Digitaria exilis TaxID=1010633 RepID=A0A835BZ24_9POAL|nr:hypothetical protein HU200_029329 [Digitaria exilis]